MVLEGKKPPLWTESWHTGFEQLRSHVAMLWFFFVQSQFVHPMASVARRIHVSTPCRQTWLLTAMGNPFFARQGHPHHHLTTITSGHRQTVSSSQHIRGEQRFHTHYMRNIVGLCTFFARWGRARVVRSGRAGTSLGHHGADAARHPCGAVMKPGEMEANILDHPNSQESEK